MIAFIDDHRQAYGVEPICKVMPIAPSTYHAHVARRADPSRLPHRLRSERLPDSALSDQRGTPAREMREAGTSRCCICEAAALQDPTVNLSQSITP